MMRNSQNSLESTSSNTQKQNCPVCRKSIKVKKDGLLYKHRCNLVNSNEHFERSNDPETVNLELLNDNNSNGHNEDNLHANRNNETSTTNGNRGRQRSNKGNRNQANIVKWCNEQADKLVKFHEKANEVAINNDDELRILLEEFIDNRHPNAKKFGRNNTMNWNGTNVDENEGITETEMDEDEEGTIIKDKRTKLIERIVKLIKEGKVSSVIRELNSHGLYRFTENKNSFDAVTALYPESESLNNEEFNNNGQIQQYPNEDEDDLYERMYECAHIHVKNFINKKPMNDTPAISGNSFNHLQDLIKIRSDIIPHFLFLCT